MQISVGPATGPDDEMGFVGFDNKPEVQDGREVIQRGRLKSGASISQAIPAGTVVRIKFDNGNGGKVTVTFKR
jgi:hypothetical protein